VGGPDLEWRVGGSQCMAVGLISRSAIRSPAQISFSDQFFAYLQRKTQTWCLHHDCCIPVALLEHAMNFVVELSDKKEFEGAPIAAAEAPG